MKKLLLLLVLFCTLKLSAQDIIIQGSTMPINPNYSVKFRTVENYEIDVEDIRSKFRNFSRTGVEVDLVLGGKIHRLQLYKFNIYTDYCKIRLGTANGMVDRKPDPFIECYRGYDANFGGQEAAITFSKNYMSLMFREGDETYHLEQVPVEFNDLNPNHFILYDSKSVISNKNISCGADEVTKFKATHEPDLEQNKNRNRFCYEVDIALACDFNYFKFYRRDPLFAEARMTTIVNLVQGDWFGGRLLADYIYNISAVFIAEDSARDPWLGVNDIFQQLTIFSSVGFTLFPGGFDVATNWTNKYTSGVVGVAYLPGTCVLTPFNICSEFTTDNNICRQLQSHELGHNWNCVHDAQGPTIMSPVVNGSFIWSGPSQWAISDWTFRIKPCLGDCSGGDIPVAEFEADPTDGCIPLVVQYTNMSINATNYKWKFAGGTPATSTAANPIVTYNSVGSFAAELEVMNPKCTTAIEKLNYINTRDKPRNVTLQYGGTLGNEIEFFGGADRGDIFKWKFHDNTTDEGPYVTKIYDKEGKFDVELCVSNDCGETCVKTKVEVYYFPTADFTSDTIAGCAPTTIKFFDQSSSNVINWTWSFPGGTPTGSFVKNPLVKYTRPGTYKVKLVVSSLKNNAQIEKDKYITIDSLPLAQFDPIINFSMVQFNNTSLFSKTHKWDFGDGSPKSTEMSPTHTYLDGRYEVTYTGTNGCGSTTTKRTITIGAKPIAGFSVQNPKGCIPFTVQFQNTSTASAQSFLWTFPGGSPSSSTDKEPIITYNSVGKYDVKLTAFEALEKDSITQSQYITVQEGPSSEFSNNVVGFVASFTNSSKNANTYFWDFGDNSAGSSATSPTHNYGVEGEFKVKLITENECGIDTLEKLVAVYLIPKVNFSSDTIRGCAPLKINFLDRSSVDVLEWSWQFESGNPATSSSKNPTISFEKAGKYTVKLTVKNGNGTNSATKLKYIDVISPIKCPKHPPKKTGTDPDNQGFSLEDQLFSRSRTEYEVNVFPNPSSDEIFIQAKSGTKFNLISLTGQDLLKGEVRSKIEKLDVSKFAKGSYFLKIDHSDYNEVIKVVINR
ncbi:MAG: PKD domain-containing protein [Saprospiraceae bacterium]